MTTELLEINGEKFRLIDEKISDIQKNGCHGCFFYDIKDKKECQLIKIKDSSKIKFKILCYMNNKIYEKVILSKEIGVKKKLSL